MGWPHCPGSVDRRGESSLNRAAGRVIKHSSSGAQTRSSPVPAVSSKSQTSLPNTGGAVAARHPRARHAVFCRRRGRRGAQHAQRAWRAGAGAALVQGGGGVGGGRGDIRGQRAERGGGGGRWVGRWGREGKRREVYTKRGAGWLSIERCWGNVRLSVGPVGKVAAAAGMAV